MKNKLSTKDRIIISALELFSEKGFDGASIRDIADRADVNIAAINYHYGSKENLIKSAFAYSYASMENEIKEKCFGTQSVEDICRIIFQSLNNHYSEISTYFQAVLSCEASAQYLSNGEFVPPGFAILLTVIQNKFPHLKIEEIDWTTRIIFSVAIHKVLLKNAVCKLYPENSLPYSQQYIDLSIQKLTKVLLLHLESIPKENA